MVTTVFFQVEKVEQSQTVVRQIQHYWDSFAPSAPATFVYASCTAVQAFWKRVCWSCRHCFFKCVLSLFDVHRSSKWQPCFKIKIIFFLRFSMCYLKRCVAPSNRWQLSYSLREFPEEEPGKTFACGTFLLHGERWRSSEEWKWELENSYLPLYLNYFSGHQSCEVNCCAQWILIKFGYSISLCAKLDLRGLSS